MGGDHAPRAVVEGIALAIREGVVRDGDVLLVGRSEVVTPMLADAGIGGVEVAHASDVVGMDESPAAAIRSKKDSSIVVGMKLVGERRADAFLSAGNTGAVVAAASLVLGRLPGVSRPGIAVPMPTPRGPAVVIDVGANIYCKPEHLQQYAIMASEYSSSVLGRSDPLVGLLNIGEEEGKGNPLIHSTHALLQQSGLNYRGFIEGQDIVSGVADVVVCEGFVGNVILKVAEGLAQFVTSMVRNALAVHPPRDEVKAALGEAFARLDYSEYGGAPLLGVAAPVLIGHGRSTPHAFMNMIRAAGAVVKHDVNKTIVARLDALRGRAAS